VSVPVGFRLTRISSPTCRCCRRDVSGPFATLMLKNSRCSSQCGLAMLYARTSGRPSTTRPIMTKWPLSKRRLSLRVVRKLKRFAFQ
jgi:hypothetical protein